MEGSHVPTSVPCSVDVVRFNRDKLPPDFHDSNMQPAGEHVQEQIVGIGFQSVQSYIFHTLWQHCGSLVHFLSLGERSEAERLYVP